MTCKTGALADLRAGPMRLSSVRCQAVLCTLNPGYVFGAICEALRFTRKIRVAREGL